MENVKELIDLLIEATEYFKKDCPHIQEYIEGKLDGFKTIRDYLERQMKHN